jgi:hypothetical protein
VDYRNKTPCTSESHDRYEKLTEDVFVSATEAGDGTRNSMKKTDNACDRQKKYELENRKKRKAKLYVQRMCRLINHKS